MHCTEPLTALQSTRLRANAMIKGDQLPSMPQEVIDAAELPHVKLGRHVRYDWGSPQLAAWWSRRQQ
jgi:hypothetical protein